MNKEAIEQSLYAECLREVGILLFVFGPLYTIFDSTISGWPFYAAVLLFSIVGAPLFYLGVRLAVRRLE